MIFERSIRSCDTVTTNREDYGITDGATYVLYAFGSDSMSYHNANRGSKEFYLKGIPS